MCLQQPLPLTPSPLSLYLPYRDAALAGISPSEPTALPDNEGLKTVTYRNKTATSTHRAEIAAADKVKLHRQPLISVALPVISTSERSKALFVSWFSPEVNTDDIYKTLKLTTEHKKKSCFHETQN